MSLIDIHLFYKNTLAFGELRYCYEINSFKRMGSLKVDYTYCLPAITKDFLSFIRSIFVKLKLEPLLPTLTETCESLRCYNFLYQIKKNIEIFHHVLCPSEMFSWAYDIFLKIVKPSFSESGSNKKMSRNSVQKFY